MAEDPRTFDYYLETTNLTSALNVQEFCKSRIDEILMLTEALKESPFRGQAFQRLPKHMRRRQMSHYIKRLPRRLRNSTLLSVKFDKSGLPKCPSRKYRRRPSALLLEYNRRQGKNIWLETHIWHAKRFHMTSKWGYSLPEKPTNRSFRACYRAMTKHCCITDLSYYSVVELQGKENVLLEGLQQCVSTNCGLTFAAKMFKNGLREGYVTIYHPNSFPYDVIGEVSFLWRPLETENEDRTIWIFIHPSFYSEIINMFKTLFSLNSVENPKQAIAREVNSTDVSDDGGKTDTVQKSKARSNFFDEVPEFFNKDGSVIMKLLKNKLNRFRLMGPLSMAIMANAFDVANLNSFKNVPSRKQDSKTSEKKTTGPNPLKRGHSKILDDECHERDGNSKRMKVDGTFGPESKENCNPWWLKFYKNELRIKCLESQAKFYEELSNFLIPNDLPPGMVFSVVVKDPRLTLPTSRIKCIPYNQGSTFLTSPDPLLCYSAIWEADLREEVSDHQIPTFVINKMRSRLIVPGSDVKGIIKDDKQDKIPVIIIQRPGLSSTNSLNSQDFGSGFDLIVPLGWAMPVWLSLIFRGARSGGLRETNSVALESKNLNGYIQPDSKSGEYENLERYNRLRSTYFKRPPNSRSNFAKIGAQSPFYFPWKILLNDWCETEDSQSQRETKFYVLRDLGKLTQLSDILGKAMCKKSRSKQDMKIFESLKLEDMNCLVPVFVRSCGKGAPKENAMLCIPTSEDIKEFQQNNICPVENAHIDPNIKTRKALKQEHEKLLRSMKRKRKLNKMKKNEEMHYSKKKGDSTLVGEKIPPSKDIVEKYKRDMEALWLKEPHCIDTIKNSCSKAILGYVVMGGFSFSQANGAGLGYITFHGLLFLLKMSFKQGVPPLLLFRNNNSVKYRFVSVQICTNKRY